MDEKEENHRVLLTSDVIAYSISGLQIGNTASDFIQWLIITSCICNMIILIIIMISINLLQPRKNYMSWTKSPFAKLGIYIRVRGILI